MRPWRKGFLVGFCLIGIPTLAVAETPPTLPQDFLFTYQGVDAAYVRKDIDGILSNYAPNCTFSVVTHSVRETHKTAGYKASLDIVATGHKRHDLVWQRQELQQLFFVPLQPWERTSSWPLQTISITSDIQKSSVNRRSTEVRLTVERKIHLHQGQVQTILNEVDEEVWGKGAQGWKLRRRTIDPKGELTLCL